MARMTFMAGDEYALMLSRLAAHSDRIAKMAIYAAVNIVADEIAKNLDNLPEEKFRKLKDGEIFVGVPEKQKADLKLSFGVTPISRDNEGNWNAKIGFDGYGRFATKAYPDGIPNQLLARSIESGSSVRRKIPFVRFSVSATRAQARQEMGQVIDEEIKKLNL